MDLKTSRKQVQVVAARVGRSCRTVWRWAAEGCNLDNPDSVREFLTGNTLRQSPNFGDPIIQNGDTRKSKHHPRAGVALPELAPVGQRGAAAALARLEEIEERAHARLIQAIEAGNPFQIKAAQEFYLRSSETLRRLDLAVETERRKADEQLPKRQVEDVARQIATWFAGSFAQFLNIESPGLMAKTDLGEFKLAAIESFRGILHRTVKASLKATPIPTWAANQVIEAWNVPTL